MAYDHPDKIGNQGDLVKHYALYLCLKTLFEKHPADTPFVYAESHADRAESPSPMASNYPKAHIGGLQNIYIGKLNLD